MNDWHEWLVYPWNLWGEVLLSNFSGFGAHASTFPFGGGGPADDFLALEDAEGLYMLEMGGFFILE